ncbi:hypothetical protein AU476_06165 [Cupriavidus sp. UYMSc13B]|nr:hypothetical protein AU476_06165 [Cupriavidus sp. UYMSc13B]
MNLFDRLRTSRLSTDRSLIDDQPAAAYGEPGAPHAVPAPPVALTRYVVYPEQVSDSEPLTIYIDARHVGTSACLTWLEDLRRIHSNVQVEPKSAQDLEELRQELVARQTRREEADQQTLNKAWRLFVDCAAIGASDVHLLLREQHAQVQVRVKGDLKVVENHSMLREEGEALARAIYTGLSTVKDATYNPLEFQNAQIKGAVFPGSGLSSVRIIRGPAYPIEEGGGSLVARLQYEQVAGRPESQVNGLRPLTLRVPDIPTDPLRLGEMGFTALQMELFEQIVRLPKGIALITGPTGSGKTTTLFELMRYQAQLFPGARQITTEDPVEYPQPWAIQLSAEGDLFQDRVRAMLRMDPDIIFVGELRKAGEAVAALQAAMTGHFVWTTLHVNDPYEVFTRLEVLDQMLLPPRLTCNHSLVSAITAQRVVSRLCPDCSQPLATHRNALPGFMLRALESWGDTSLVRVRGEGCPTCMGDAVVGQQAVAEIVLTSEGFMEDVLERGVAVARRNHRRKSGSDKSMLSNAMELVLSGKLSPIDVHRGVEKIEFKDEHEGDAQ